MKRPTGLTIIGWLALIGGVLQVLGSLGLVGIGAFGILIGTTGALETLVLLGISFSMWTGMVLIALGAVGIAIGAGMLSLRPWSWTAGIVVYALNLVAGLVLLYATGFGWTMLFVVLMSASIIGYLSTATAREALGHTAAGGATPQAPHPA